MTLPLAVPVGPRDHKLGSDAAPVTLVEYGDYECGFCARAHGTVKELLSRHGGKILYVYRHFPLVQTHEHAVLAAQAVEAAGAQGFFWEMHDLLFENNQALDLEDVRDYARGLGLDIDAFDAVRSGAKTLDRIKADFQSGARSGVAGTPAFFVNGQRHELGLDARSLEEALFAGQNRLR